MKAEALFPMSRIRLPLALIALESVWVLAFGRVHAAESDPIEFFEKKIRPVLVTECVDCHNAEKQKGGLRLDYREAWKKGGDSGPAIVPGDSKGSLLLRSIRHEEADLKMPSKAPKLSAGIIADFETWVRMGAPDPREEPSKAAESGWKSDGSKWQQLLAMRRGWWSFQPVRAVEVPSASAAEGSRHPVDRFLRVKQAEKGLKAQGPASASTVLRRLSFGLTGLPPEAAQVNRFESEYVSDPARAVEQAVDGFLASERFGEHWARHWMDLVRYSETHGSETDQPLPMAWRYRDYLVRAFNQDVPLDSLIREHLAGDLLPKPRVSPEGLNESSTGPAHFRMVEHGENAVDTREDQVRVLDNQIDVVTKAFQAMTVSCARCHDHKFDAVSQRDYYALQGVFANGHMGQRVLDTPEHLNQHNGTLEQALEQVRQGLAREWHRAAKQLPQEIPDVPEQEDAWKQAFSLADTDPAHPLRAWRQLRLENLPQQWEALRQRVEEECAARKASNVAHFRTVWDFREGQAEGWLRSGAGLAQKPEAGRFRVFPSGDRLVEVLYPPALMSHWFSTRQHGVFVSPAFTIETGRISVRAFGWDGLVRLVPDNYAVARRFNSKAVLLSEKDGWQMLGDVELPNPDRRKGQRARLEFVTREDASIPVQRPPQSSAHTTPRGKAGALEDSYFGVAEIVFHNRPTDELPQLEHSGLRLLLQKSPPSTRAEFASRYGEVLSEAVEAWARHAASEDQVAFLNAFIESGLLPVHLSDVPALQPAVERYRALHREVPVPRRAPGIHELEASDAPLLARGDHKSPGALVPRGYLEVLGKGPFQTQQSGRLELAEQIASSHNPLTSRVMANRIWHWVYGVGIVPTVDNFGRNGEEPTHPELLEYLAGHLMENGWSLKKALRFLMTTETFRSRSQPYPDALQRDPANRWLSHMRVKRLEAEAIRDSLLSVSGMRVDQKGGPGAPLSNTSCRSLYLVVRRTELSPFLSVFDAPQPFTTFGRRDQTTVPAQSLTLLNGELAALCATRWAQAQGVSSPQEARTPEQRLEAMFLSAFARKPTAAETQTLLELLSRWRLELEQAVPTGGGAPESEAWGHLAHTLFNLKEFIYLP